MNVPAHKTMTRTDHDAQAPSASSSHVIDLRKTEEPAATRPTVRGRRHFIARIAAALDDRIHFHDHHARSVSVRPRGWRDFPPPEARDLAHAVGVTAKRFFNEHPLADLAVLSLAHLIVLLAWKIVTAPFALLMPSREAERIAEREIVEPAPAPAPVRTARPVALPLLAIAPVAKPEPVATAPVLASAPELLPAPEPAPKAVRKPFVLPRLALLRIAFPEFKFGLRPALAFAVVAMLVVVPVGAFGTLGNLQQDKDRVIGIGKEAARHLQEAVDASAKGDLDAAHGSFEAAEAEFARAKQELGILANVLNAAGTLLPGSKIGSAGPLLNAGHDIAAAGAIATAGIDEALAQDLPTGKIAAARARLDAAIPHLERATREMAKVSPDALPEEYRGYVTLARERMPQGLEAAKKASTASGALLSLLGADEPKRYLLVFQNNAELRPTGGFMGSFALIDVRGGEIVNLEVPGGGTYDLQGQLSARVRSPQPLHLINPRWEFQDANWDPDFPTTAERITWFYEKAGGPTVDGVIAINATFFEDLLAVTGPVEMPEYGKTITAENFFLETQKQVELDYDKEENKPKAFIGDLAPKMIERLKDADAPTMVRLAQVGKEGLAAKEVMFWSRDREEMSQLSSLGWTGEMKQTGGDYLAIVHANIAGQKTDLKMTDDVSHDAKVLPDGSAVVTLTIARSHAGEKGALFSGVRNVDYMRVYVPKGAMLIETTGFAPPDPKLFKVSDPADGADPEIEAEERAARIDRRSGTMIGEEHGKTWFGNWVQTDPGERSVVSLVYQLPAGTYPVEHPDAKEKALGETVDEVAPDRLRWSLLVQRQSGANPARLVSSVDLPRGFTPVWNDPERERDDRDRWTLETTVDRDLLLGGVAESR